MEKQFSEIKLIIGLGNPEQEYGNTYHNAGKLFVDYVLEKLASSRELENDDFHKKTSGNFESCAAGNFKLVKPTNYMNENGKSAKSALKSFGMKTDSLFVAHDDSDIEIGKYKISFGNGSAGHNGVQSVIENVGTKDFLRVRIGIRPKEIKDERPSSVRTSAGRRIKAMDIVLKKITAADKKLMRSAFEKAYEKLF